MSLDDILQSIDKKTQKEIEAVKASSNEKKVVLEKEWADKIQARKEKLVGIAQKKADDKLKQAQFKIKSQSQAELLKRQQNILQNSYDHALKKMSSASDDEYIKLMEKLLHQLPAASGKVYSVNGKEDLLKKALHNVGGKHELAEKTVSGSGGFIFKSSQIDIDNTFEALIENVKQDTLTGMAKILFD